jgi:hypothetical protein
MESATIPITVDACEDCETLRLAELGRELSDRESGGDTSDTYAVAAVKYVLENGDGFIKANLKSQIQASIMNVMDRQALLAMTEAYDRYREKCSVQAREISQLSILVDGAGSALKEAVEAKRAGQTQ